MGGLEEADDFAIFGVGRHPVPGFRRQPGCCGEHGGVHMFGELAVVVRHLSDLAEHILEVFRGGCLPFGFASALFHRCAFVCAEEHLTFGGLGSALSGRISARTACIGVAILGAIEAMVLPKAIPSFLAFELPMRVMIAAAFIAPLGVLMGVPFPSGLRQTGQGLLPSSPFYWGLNGILSVIGSVTTVFVALLYGFQVAMLLGAAVYLVAATATFKS